MATEAAIAETWNALAGRAATLADAQRLIPVTLVQARFGNIWGHDNGWFVRLPLGHKVAPETPLQAMGIATIAGYFSNPLFDIGHFASAVFLAGLRIESHAEACLAAMRSHGLGPLGLMTDLRTYTIVYGRSVLLEFRPVDGIASNPTESFLASIQYNFGPKFCGSAPPTMALKQ